MSDVSAEDEIKEHAIKLGAWVVGIASPEDVSRYAPKGHRPDDMLRGAKSVVVVGTGLASAGVWRAGKARAQASVAYNRFLASGIAQQVVTMIEKRYEYYAMPCPNGLVAGRYPYVSMKLLAEMAGLGTRSMAAGIVLNPTHGLLYYGAALTTMPLEADGPLSDPVCPHPSCVKLWDKKSTTPCLQACPTCLSGELDGYRIKFIEYRQSLCVPRAQTTATDAFQKVLLQAMNEQDQEKRMAIVLGSHFTRTVYAMSTTRELSAQCFECVRRCPIGGESRRLRQ